MRRYLNLPRAYIRNALSSSNSRHVVRVASHIPREKVIQNNRLYRLGIRRYSTTANEKRADSSLLDFLKAIRNGFGAAAGKEIFAALALFAFYLLSKTGEFAKDVRDDYLDQEEIFKTAAPSSELLKHNFIKDNLNLIKQQLMELNNIRSQGSKHQSNDIISEKAIEYDKNLGKLVVFLKLRFNAKESVFRLHYSLSEHENMEVLEKAINADIAFKEFFISHPYLVVRTSETDNTILIGKKTWSLSYRLYRAIIKKSVFPRSLKLSKVWDGESIKLAEMRSLLAEDSFLGDTDIFGDTWQPSLKIILPVFKVKAKNIKKDDPDIVERVRNRSWRAGGPVKLEELSLLRVTHWDFEGNIQSGRLIVHHSVADEVIDIFKDLFDKRFPIKQVKLIDEYYYPGERNGDKIDGKDIGDIVDKRSMCDNNSSALHVRSKTNSTEWSQHSTGTAIDINPLQNPYVKFKDAALEEVALLLPKEGGAFVNRNHSGDRTGMHNEDSISAFKNRGWFWGGDWKDSDYVRDYHHFSKLKRSEKISNSKAEEVAVESGSNSSGCFSCR